MRHNIEGWVLAIKLHWPDHPHKYRQGSGDCTKINSIDILEAMETHRNARKSEINVHIMNLHHGLNQLESYLYGDGRLHRTTSISVADLTEEMTRRWKEVVDKVRKTLKTLTHSDDIPMFYGQFDINLLTFFLLHDTRIWLHVDAKHRKCQNSQP